MGQETAGEGPTRSGVCFSTPRRGAVTHNLARGQRSGGRRGLPRSGAVLACLRGWSRSALQGSPGATSRGTGFPVLGLRARAGVNSPRRSAEREREGRERERERERETVALKRVANHSCKTGVPVTVSRRAWEFVANYLVPGRVKQLTAQILWRSVWCKAV